MNTTMLVLLIVAGVLLLAGFVIGLVFLILFLVKSLGGTTGGWGTLAEAYGTMKAPTGQITNGQTIQIGAVTYNRCVTLGVADEGLCVAIWRRTALLPWSEFKGIAQATLDWQRMGVQLIEAKQAVEALAARHGVVPKGAGKRFLGDRAGCLVEGPGQVPGQWRPEVRGQGTPAWQGWLERGKAHRSYPESTAAVLPPRPAGIGNKRKMSMAPSPKFFEQVADFCERHLEATRGREIGMTFGAAIQALGRLAAHPGDKDDPEWRRLKKSSDELLVEFSTRFIVDYGWVGGNQSKPVEPTSMTTNMIYDTGKPDTH